MGAAGDRGAIGSDPLSASPVGRSEAEPRERLRTACEVRMSKNRIVIWAAVAVLSVGVARFLMGQAVPKKTQAAASVRPDPSAFKTYDDYEEALISWIVDQKVVTTGKQVIVNAPPVGRYQIVFNPNVRADTFLLDTQTGKTWVQTQVSDAKDKPTIWLYRERVDNEQELLDWSKRQTSKDGSKEK